MIPLHNPLPDMKATQRLAEQLAPLLRRGDVLALQGPLGVGKTAFARCLLQNLDVQGDVPSPTFTMLQTYDMADFTVYHFDLYRLKSEAELDELGWDDALNDGVVLVEWPELTGARLPKQMLVAHFIMDEQNKRICNLEPSGSWNERLRAVS